MVLPLVTASLALAALVGGRGPVRWAIVLEEGVRLPWPTGEPAGTALARGERRALSDVWVQGDAQEAWFVRNASGSSSWPVSWPAWAAGS